jgi:hypothetical protein
VVEYLGISVTGPPAITPAALSSSVGVEWLSESIDLGVYQYSLSTTEPFDKLTSVSLVRFPSH